MYWTTPKIIIRRFKKQVWHMNRCEKVIYLTFDDGPTPNITVQALDILKQYNAKATFFCLGRNADRHRDLIDTILNEGHAIGNHTYSHLKGWKCPVKQYIQDAELAKRYINSNLFRPPYGRIKKMQLEYLQKDFKIIMWDVLTHDYNRHLSSKLIFRSVKRRIKNGSIVVFHDSKKAAKNMLEVLPRVLKHFSEKGYTFRSLE